MKYKPKFSFHVWIGWWPKTTSIVVRRESCVVVAALLPHSQGVPLRRSSPPVWYPRIPHFSLYCNWFFNRCNKQQHRQKIKVFEGSIRNKKSIGYYFIKVELTYDYTIHLSNNYNRQSFRIWTEVQKINHLFLLEQFQILIASNPASYPTALVRHCNLVCWFTFNSRKFSLLSKVSKFNG